MSKVSKTLTIAGSDSGGGAGIQADLKTYSALGCYGSSVITALTAQNTQGVTDISGVEPAFIKSQLQAVLTDIGADAIKIGMLHSSDVIEAVADILNDYPTIPVVLDPVMVAKSGDRLLQPEAISALKSKLLAKATIITPNIPEAEDLTGQSIATEDHMRSILPSLLHLGPRAALLKGGHLEGTESPDFFLGGGDAGILKLPAKKIDSLNTHGTGCTLSSAIAAYLAKGYDHRLAVSAAKSYMQASLAASVHFVIGEGKGPVHHFHAMW